MKEITNTDSFSNLIPIACYGKEVNARDLHAFLGSKKDFSNWIKRRIDKFGFVENLDYRVLEFDY